jgi:hypothetical protein
MTLSGCDDQRPMGPSHPNWGSGRVLIAWLATTPEGHLLMLPLRLVGVNHICGGPVDISATAGQLSSVDDVVRVVVGPEQATLQGALRGGG